MSTNLNTGTRGLSGEGWAALVGVLGSAVLVAKKLLSAKPPKVEHVSRADFYAESMAVRERLNSTHLALLEKLEANHREALAVLELHSLRIARVEAAVARVEERTR